MEQEPNKSQVSGIDNYMSVVKSQIADSPDDFSTLKKYFDIDSSSAAKLKMQQFEKTEGSLDYIYATLFDNIIFSLLDEQKMYKKDYLFLFYYFFKKEYYNNFIRLNNKNTGKFLKKFFNSCVNGERDEIIFENSEIGEFINYYIFELFRFIGKTKITDKIKCLKDIQELRESKKEIKNLEQLDKRDFKFVKNLIKYTLAFANILENSKYYKNYHLEIYQLFNDIEDKLFKNYFRKQLYKMCLNKGVYKHGNFFMLYLFNPLKCKDNNLFENKLSTLFNDLVKNILGYESKYSPEEKEDIKKKKENKSSFYLLNSTNLFKIINDLGVNDDLENILLCKFTESFNKKINLFLDDGNQLRVAEFILTNTINQKNIIDYLDKMELIKPYINNMNNLNNNKDFWQYYEYLFFDLSVDTYILKSFNEESSSKNKKKLLEQPKTEISFLSQNPSQMLNNNSSFIDLNNDISEKEKKDNVDIIIKKFQNSNDKFIQRYFNLNYKDSLEEEKLDDILEQKSIESLFLLLDIIYRISNKAKDKETIKKSIKDIKKIIRHIIEKCYKENECNKFNCAIFNFILKVDSKYLPSPDNFDVINSITEILLKINYDEFIKSYPFYIILILNYYPSNNCDVNEFFKILKAYLIGYSDTVFDSLDDEQKHTIQLNYISLFHFIIEQLLNLYLDNISEENMDDNILKFLPYCVNCRKKFKNPIICSKYLSQCNHCYHNCLYVNTNLYNYLKNNKKDLEAFIKDTAYEKITNITFCVLHKFEKKLNEKDRIPLYSYHLYYKLMKEHFQFLNYIQNILGKNIPFTEDKITLGGKVMTLQELIDHYFEEFEKEKNIDTKTLNEIYNSIKEDGFKTFNNYRKAIKQNCALTEIKYSEKNIILI